MMKKSVDGLYEERKHTIRFFLCGNGSLLIAGMMFGLTALRSPARICVVMVFALNLVGTAMYMLHITRPKFRVPKGMRGKNKPAVFHMAGGAFDPELGVSGYQPPAIPMSNR